MLGQLHITLSFFFFPKSSHLVALARLTDSKSKHQYLKKIFLRIKTYALNQYTRILMTTSELKFIGGKEAELLLCMTKFLKRNF